MNQQNIISQEHIKCPVKSSLTYMNLIATATAPSKTECLAQGLLQSGSLLGRSPNTAPHPQSAGDTPQRNTALGKVELSHLSHSAHLPEGCSPHYGLQILLINIIWKRTILEVTGNFILSLSLLCDVLEDSLIQWSEHRETTGSSLS